MRLIDTRHALSEADLLPKKSEDLKEIKSSVQLYTQAGLIEKLSDKRIMHIYK